MNDSVFVESLPLIPLGRYRVMYCKHEQKFLFGCMKIFVTFEIIEGPYQGIRLYRAYNLHNKSNRGDLSKELILVYGKRIPKGMKLPITTFKGKVLSADVRTVTKDKRQKTLAAHLQYSVIECIVAVEAG